MSVRPIHLSNNAGWRAIEGLLKKNQSRPTIADTILRHLRELGAKAALVEEDYIDRDFSEAYSAYYAKTFRRHTKLCTRLLFFSSSLDFLASSDDVSATLQALEQQKGTFLGFAVLRPISEAPLAQVVLKPSPVQSLEGHLLVRARYSVHVLGVEFELEGVPMTQQDSRVGACAQAVIWSMARHFYAKHRGPWLSTVTITSAAIASPDHSINTAIPAGSEFLTGNNMVAALRAAGRETLLYAGKGTNPPDWGQLRPADIINRYVDSGIPVLVGLTFPGQNIGHAVVATGQILKDTVVAASLPFQPTRAEYCEAFYVNDDQLGENLRVGIVSGSAVAEVSGYNIKDNCQYLIVPLPEKVYLPAEKTEAIAWDVLKKYAADWAAHKNAHTGKLGASELCGDIFVAEINRNEVLARTYLTYGWKYKHRAMRNKLPNAVRRIIRNLDSPRFVYVTEFATVASTSGKTKYERRIFAHCAVDATAKNQGLDSVLLFHAPGMCFWHAHNATNEFVRNVSPIKDDAGYYPKLRGETDFSNYK